MRFSLKEAVHKAAEYCARQERSHQEVRDKLYQWGMRGEEIETVIVELIGSNFLNEQRFADAFTIGKLRQKRWGRRKIQAGLRAKRVSDACITNALAAIEEDEYVEVLKEVAIKRAQLEKALDPFVAKQRVIKYLVQRGFEPDLARKVIDEEKPFV